MEMKENKGSPPDYVNLFGENAKMQVKVAKTFNENQKNKKQLEMKTWEDWRMKWTHWWTIWLDESVSAVLFVFTNLEMNYYYYYPQVSMGKDELDKVLGNWVV